MIARAGGAVEFLVGRNTKPRAGAGGTPEPSAARLGELLLPGAGGPGLRRCCSVGQQAAPPLAVLKAQGESGEFVRFPVLYFGLVRYGFSDWAVAIAVDPASGKNVTSIVSLPASPLGSGANREWGAVRTYRSDRGSGLRALDRLGRF